VSPRGRTGPGLSAEERTQHSMSPPGRAVGKQPWPASVAHSRKQNSTGKMILIVEGTTIPFCGVGAQGLSSALASNLVMRQTRTRGIVHRVAQAVSEYGTMEWTWLITQPYPRIHQPIATVCPFDHRGSLRKPLWAPADRPVPHPKDSQWCPLFTSIQFAAMSWPVGVAPD
jgi:hypothetical protein